MRNFTSFLLIKLFILFNITIYAQWTQTPGLVSDRITAFGVSGTDLFAGTERAQIFLSTNNGSSWSGANGNFTWAPVSAFAVTGGYIIASADSGGGMYRSSDNGKTWEFAGTGLTSTRVSSLALKGTTLFAGTKGGGVFLSNDNGSNWTPVNHGLTNRQVRSIAVLGDNVFAGTYESGIFVSSDNGANWSQVNTGLTNTRILSLLARGTDLFAGTFGGGVFRSEDNGSHWTQINSGLTDNYIFALASIGPNLFAGTAANGVCFSTNNGDSWTQITSGLPDYTSVTAFAAIGINLFMASFTGKIFLTTDFGTNWTEINSGLTTNYITSLAVSGSNVFAGTDTAGVFISYDNGVKWIKINNGLTSKRINSLAVMGTDIFAGTDSGGVFRSTDNGASWNAANYGLTNTIVKSVFVNGSYLYAGTAGSGAFLSTNNGTNWSPINNGMETQGVHSFAVLGPYLFAGAFGVYRSSDNGANWTRVSNGLEPEVVTSLTVLDTILFAGLDMGGGIFKTEDYGDNWASLRGGFIYAFAVTGNNLFIGTASSGALYSGDKGNSLTLINEGFLENNSIYSLTLNGTYLFAGSYLHGVWRRPLSEIIDLTPGSPKLVSVPDKSKDEPVDLTLSWSSVPMADSYHLQISTDSHFGTMVLDDGAITGTSKDVKKLKYNTTYYWRVSAQNSSGESPWSEMWKFTTMKAALGIPLLLKPLNNATDLKENIHCYWRSVPLAELYKICIAEDNKKAKIVLFCDSLKDTVKEIKGLKQGSRYYWKVMAMGAGGSSEYSDVWNFTVILFPPEGLKLQVLSKNRIRFSWKAVPNESAKYIIERRQFKDKEFIVLDTTKAGVTVYTDSAIKSSAEYFYRLKAFTPYAVSEYSEQVKTLVTEIASVGSVPLSYNLLQNYPNPFNPATAVQYELPEESNVSLSVYDILGKLVGRLISSVQPAGRNSVLFDAQDLPSGLYIYVINARSVSSSKGFTQARKMILLR